MWTWAYMVTYEIVYYNPTDTVCREQRRDRDRKRLNYEELHHVGNSNARICVRRHEQRHWVTQARPNDTRGIETKHRKVPKAKDKDRFTPQPHHTGRIKVIASARIHEPTFPCVGMAHVFPSKKRPCQPKPFENIPHSFISQHH